jgi:hypothetical protein
LQHSPLPSSSPMRALPSPRSILYINVILISQPPWWHHHPWQQSTSTVETNNTQQTKHRT